MSIPNRRASSIFLAALAFLSGVPIEAQEADKRLNAQDGAWKVYAAEKPIPGLPRVLLIGDSVLNGYRGDVARMLRGVANVDAWVNPYHQASPGLHQMMKELLAGGAYAVVHFNIGLHGWAKGRIPDGQFEPLMRAYVRVLRENAGNARLIWASTTPVTAKGQPRDLDPEINPTILEHNRMAAIVVRDAGIPIDDLYPLAASHLDLAKGDQFHWTAEAYRLMAASVAESVRVAIVSAGTKH